MTRTFADIQTSARIAGPSGPIRGESGVAVIDGEALTGRLQAVYTLVDADAPVAHEVHRRLRAAFQPGGDVDQTVPGMEELFLTALLHRLGSQLEDDLPVVIAMRRGHELLIRARGGACAYVGASRLAGGTLRRLPEEGEDQHVVPWVPVASGDVLVLAGAEVARFVREEEAAEALRDCPALDDAVTWIVTLASRRGGRVSRAAVVRLVDTSPSIQRNGTGETSPAHGGSAVRRHLSRLVFSAAVVVIVLLVAIGAFVYGRMHVGGHAANPGPAALPTLRPTAPGGLVAVQDAPWRVRLSWQPVPRASGYTVGVGRHRYHTAGPSLALVDVLRPGRSYRWWASATFSAGHTMTSPRVPLRLLPQANPYWHFPSLGSTPSLVVLSLANPSRRPARVTVIATTEAHRILGSPVVDAGSHVDLLIGPVPGVRAGDGLDVIATAPVIAIRSTKSGSATSTDYGFPQQFLAVSRPSP